MPLDLSGSRAAYSGADRASESARRARGRQSANGPSRNGPSSRPRRPAGPARLSLDPRGRLGRPRGIGGTAFVLHTHTGYPTQTLKLPCRNDSARTSPQADVVMLELRQRLHRRSQRPLPRLVSRGCPRDGGDRPVIFRELPPTEPAEYMRLMKANMTPTHTPTVKKRKWEYFPSEVMKSGTHLGFRPILMMGRNTTCPQTEKLVEDKPKPCPVGPPTNRE